MATLLVACSLASVAWVGVPRASVWAWISATLLVAFFRSLLVARYRRRSESLQPATWAGLYRLLALSNGLVWGGAAVFFLPYQTEEARIFTVFVLGGMAAGSVPLVSADRWAAPIFVAAILLPLSFQLARGGDWISGLMAAIILVFLGTLWASSYYTHSYISRALELNLERGELLGRTQSALENQEKAERELREVNRALERRVAERTSALQAEIVERRTYAKKLRHLADHDGLTGLPNRLRLLELLEEAIETHSTAGEGAALLFVDLDRFKTVNDSLGHIAGDSLLRIVAKRLQGAIRSTDTVARLGGDEFVVLLRNVQRRDIPRRIAKQIFASLRDPVAVEGQSFYVGCSIGVSRFPIDGTTAEDLLTKSNLALRRAKDSGRARLRIYSEEMSRGIHRRLSLETELRRAYEEGDLEVHYRPILDTQSGRVRSLEALLRWTHPEMGVIAPATFVPVAEETGLIVPIGERVLSVACEEARRWSTKIGRDVSVSVNLSPRQFLEADLVNHVERALHRSGLHPHALELEVTEGLLMSDTTRSAQTFQALKELGTRIVIDDFGSGYSSLNYLKRFPIDWLKIDRSFVAELEEMGDASQIVTAIIGLAHNLRFGVVAEGVETREQFESLKSEGCDAVQGFLFSRAMAGPNVVPWLTGSALSEVS